MEQMENKEQDDRLKPSQIHISWYSNDSNTLIKSRDCQTRFKNQNWNKYHWQEIYFKYKDTNSSKYREWKNIYHSVSNN